MSPAELFSQVTNSGVGSQLIGLVTVIGGLAAIYHFFVEFVESNEQAVRAWNNKPDFYRQKMTKRRKVVIFSSLGIVIASVVLMIATSWNKWLLVPEIPVALVVVATALLRWPRKKGEMALINPGFKLKIPGLISYKRGSIAIDTRVVIVDETIDASGNLISLGMRYRWSRTRNSARSQWRSNIRVSNLEASEDEEIKVVAMRHVAGTKEISTLTPEELDELCAKVLEICQKTFRYKFGTKIYELNPIKLGAPPQVAGSALIANALKEGRLTIN